MTQLPPPPAADAVLFRTSLRRVVLLAGAGAAGVMLVFVGIVAGLTLLFIDASAVSRLLLPGLLPISAVTFAVMVGPTTVTHTRFPRWVRVSSAGLELATMSRAVLIPWPVIQSVTVRGRSLYTVIEVVPTDPALVSVQLPVGRAPQMHVRKGCVGYEVGLGLFPGGAGPAVAALRERGVLVTSGSDRRSGTGPWSARRH